MNEPAPRQATLFGYALAADVTPATSIDLPVGWPVPGDGRRLWTSRYQNMRIAETDLVPVRITLGYPRFCLAYQVAAHVPELAPDGWMFHLEGDDFRRPYWAKLERIGVDRLRAIFAEVMGHHGGRPLVLLCFEDVLHGDGCHRRDFADFWLVRTGEIVPELDWREARP